MVRWTEEFDELELEEESSRRELQSLLAEPKFVKPSSSSWLDPSWIRRVERWWTGGGQEG